MKRFFLIGVLFVVQGLFALSPPCPIEGTSSIYSAKQFTLGSGSYVFQFDFPEGFGVGDMRASPDGSGQFALFPLKGGFGASIIVTPFESESLLDEEFFTIKASFDSTVDLVDGFEVELKKAWYSCRKSGQELIQTWYSVPRKEQNNREVWGSLKRCLSVIKKEFELEVIPEKSSSFVKVSEMQKGLVWKKFICHDPNGILEVAFEPEHLMCCTANQETTPAYYLKFGRFSADGFFYIKWNVEEPNTEAAYESHLNEILQDIQAIDPKHKVTGKPFYDLDNGYALWEGSPYKIVTVLGNDDHFFFGFAIKNPSIGPGIDVNDLIQKRVKWGHK